MAKSDPNPTYEVSEQTLKQFAARLAFVSERIEATTIATDAIAAIVEGFRHNEDAELTPAAVASLLDCCHLRLSNALIDMMQAVGDANDVFDNLTELK